MINLIRNLSRLADYIAYSKPACISPLARGHLNCRQTEEEDEEDGEDEGAQSALQLGTLPRSQAHFALGSLHP